MSEHMDIWYFLSIVLSSLLAFIWIVPVVQILLIPRIRWKARLMRLTVYGGLLVAIQILTVLRPTGADVRDLFLSPSLRYTNDLLLFGYVMVLGVIWVYLLMRWVYKKLYSSR